MSNSNAIPTQHDTNIKNEGIYGEDKAYGFEKKIHLSLGYFEALKITINPQPIIKSLSESLGGSRNFVGKNAVDYVTHIIVSLHSEIHAN